MDAFAPAPHLWFFTHEVSSNLSRCMNTWFYWPQLDFWAHGLVGKHGASPPREALVELGLSSRWANSSLCLHHLTEVWSRREPKLQMWSGWSGLFHLKFAEMMFLNTEGWRIFTWAHPLFSVCSLSGGSMARKGRERTANVRWRVWLVSIWSLKQTCASYSSSVNEPWMSEPLQEQTSHFENHSGSVLLSCLIHFWIG